LCVERYALKISGSGRKGVIKVASGLVLTAVTFLNDRRPQGATLQVVFSFTHKLTTAQQFSDDPNAGLIISHDLSNTKFLNTSFTSRSPTHHSPVILKKFGRVMLLPNPIFSRS